MNEITFFGIIAISIFGVAMMVFKLKMDECYHRDIPYMPKQYANMITGALIIQIVGSIINLVFMPFPYSTIIIFMLLGIVLTVVVIVDRKRSHIIREHWAEQNVGGE